MCLNQFLQESRKKINIESFILSYVIRSKVKFKSRRNFFKLSIKHQHHIYYFQIPYLNRNDIGLYIVSDQEWFKSLKQLLLGLLNLQLQI